MSNDTQEIAIPPDLEWEYTNENSTHLGTTVQMWGITFYVDAFAVTESGEAVCADGARLLKLVRLIDGYEVGAFYETVELRPGRNFMILFTPGRSSTSNTQTGRLMLQAYLEHPEGLTDEEVSGDRQPEAVAELNPAGPQRFKSAVFLI
jgi:hypothetical protein